MNRLADGDFQRLLALVADRADSVGVWAATVEVLRRQHPHVIGALARKCLVDTYMRLHTDLEMTTDELTMPLRERPSVKPKPKPRADATIEDHEAAVLDADRHVALSAAKHATHSKAIQDLSLTGAVTLGQLLAANVA